MLVNTAKKLNSSRTSIRAVDCFTAVTVDKLISKDGAML